jgi:hypothetical protein
MSLVTFAHHQLNAFLRACASSSSPCAEPRNKRINDSPQRSAKMELIDRLQDALEGRIDFEGQKLSERVAQIGLTIVTVSVLSQRR